MSFASSSSSAATTAVRAISRSRAVLGAGAGAGVGAGAGARAGSRTARRSYAAPALRPDPSPSPAAAYEPSSSRSAPVQSTSAPRPSSTSGPNANPTGTPVRSPSGRKLATLAEMDALTPLAAQSFLSDLLHLSPTHAFEPKTALQILTHKSYRYAHLIRYPGERERDAGAGGAAAAAVGSGGQRRGRGSESYLHASAQQQPGVSPHNGRFQFLGRRALATYLALFVHSHVQSTTRLAQVDFLRGKRLDDKLEAMRHAHNLGREVGGRWGVGTVMRWDRNETSVASGALALQGQTVEAILGGVFATLGSPAAQRAFYLHVLPHVAQQLRDPALVERALVARDEVRKEGQGGIVLQ